MLQHRHTYKIQLLYCAAVVRYTYVGFYHVRQVEPAIACRTQMQVRVSCP